MKTATTKVNSKLAMLHILNNIDDLNILTHLLLVHGNMVDNSIKIGFHLVMYLDIEPGPLGWHTSALTTEQQEVRQ